MEGEREGAAQQTPSPSTTERGQQQEQGQQQGTVAAAAITRAPFLKRKELAFEPNHASTAMVGWLMWLVGETPPCLRALCMCMRSSPTRHATPRHTPQLLGDVDGDGEQELVLGGLDGSLAIFKVGPSVCLLIHRSSLFCFTDSPPPPPSHLPKKRAWVAASPGPRPPTSALSGSWPSGASGRVPAHLPPLLLSMTSAMIPAHRLSRRRSSCWW